MRDSERDSSRLIVYRLFRTNVLKSQSNFRRFGKNTPLLTKGKQFPCYPRTAPDLMRGHPLGLPSSQILQVFRPSQPLSN